MHDPNDRRFCPHCGFELDAYGGCRECDPDSETDENACPPPIRARHFRQIESVFDLPPADNGARERDLGGCLPVTPPLGLVTGNMRKDPK